MDDDDPVCLFSYILVAQQGVGAVDAAMGGTEGGFQAQPPGSDGGFPCRRHPYAFDRARRHDHQLAGAAQQDVEDVFLDDGVKSAYDGQSGVFTDGTRPIIGGQNAIARALVRAEYGDLHRGLLFAVADTVGGFPGVVDLLAF